MPGKQTISVTLATLNRGLLAQACLAAALGIVPAPALCQFNETVLQTFAYLPKGANPHAAVTVDAAGNFYGTTFQGGDAR
jgi:hypothetical protein